MTILDTLFPPDESLSLLDRDRDAYPASLERREVNTGANQAIPVPSVRYNPTEEEVRLYPCAYGATPAKPILISGMSPEEFQRQIIKRTNRLAEHAASHPEHVAELERMAERIRYEQQSY